MFHMVCSMFPDNINDRSIRLTRIVKISQPISETRAQMEQRCCWAIKHAPISVSGPSDDALKQTQDTSHAIYLVECSAKVHLRRPGVRETHVNVAGQQATHQ